MMLYYSEEDRIIFEIFFPLMTCHCLLKTLLALNVFHCGSGAVSSRFYCESCLVILSLCAILAREIAIIVTTNPIPSLKYALHIQHSFVGGRYSLLPLFGKFARQMIPNFNEMIYTSSHTCLPCFQLDTVRSFHFLFSSFSQKKMPS